MKIKSIKKLTEVYDRYDLTVSTTNNFYANGILIHNTSQRVAKNIEVRPLKWWEKIINRFTKIDNKSVAILNGTRRVILNNNGKRATGFHPDNLRDEAAARITPYLDDYMHVYFEVVGWESFDSTIMPGSSMSKIIDKEAKKMYPEKIEYTYGCPKGTFEIYVYRISHVLPSGKEIDMLWEDVKKWCTHYGIKHVPEVETFIYDGDKDTLVKRIEALAEGKDPIAPTQPKEGVCVRIDSNRWQCFKEKQFLFKVLEGIAKENDNYTDIEEEAAQQ